MYTEPNDYVVTPAVPPTTIVLYKNNLGDPNFLPINIDLGDISTQGFEYLKDKAVASSGVNYDVYDKLWREHGIEAVNWYEENPHLPGSSNPHVNPLIPLPLELVKNDSKSEPVSDIETSGLGAESGDQLALATDTNDDAARAAYLQSGGLFPWSYLDASQKEYWRSKSQPSDPFANELKPNLGAKDGDEVALFGNKPPNPNEKQGRGSHINIINYYQSDGMMGTKPEGWTDQDIQNYINKFYLNKQSSNTNANDDVKLAGTFDLMKRGQVPFLTPNQVDKILVDPKYQQLLQDDPDLIKQLQRMRAKNNKKQPVSMVASYQKRGRVLSEGVGLGHFEPEQLNVNIEDLRTGIMPEFPEEAPPELINGYSSKSRLAPKKLERSSFIKITKKDLAKNHKLKDSEIKDFMNKINAVNDFIKKHPEELIYAQTRYPKSDPRLAQLNWEMDQKLNASKQYMHKHYPENQRLFNKIQKSINKNIELTDPKSFKGVKTPKFKGVDLTDFKRRKAVVSRHFKKAIRKNKK